MLLLSHINRQIRLEVFDYFFKTFPLVLSIYDLEWFLDAFPYVLKYLCNIVLRDFFCDYSSEYQRHWAGDWTAESLERLVQLGKELDKLRIVQVMVTRHHFATTDAMAAMKLDQFRGLQAFQLVRPSWWGHNEGDEAEEMAADKIRMEQEEEIRKVVCSK